MTGIVIRRISIAAMCAAALCLATVMTYCGSTPGPSGDEQNLLVTGGVSSIDSALAANGGKWVVVNVWATWCKPCVKETPDLVELHDELRGDGFAMFAISADFLTTPALPAATGKVTSFMEQYDVPYPNILFTEKAHAMADRLDLSGALPETLVFAPDGTVATRFVGLLGERQFNRIRQLVGS